MSEVTQKIMTSLTFYNSSLNKAELEKVKDAVENGKTKLLFVAPETIAKEKFIFF